MNNKFFMTIIIALGSVTIQYASGFEQEHDFEAIERATLFSDGDQDDFISKARDKYYSKILQYLQDGMNPNVQHSLEGFTALHRASSRDEKSVRALLLNYKGVDINIQDCNGHTPLHYAILYNCPSAVTDLLAAGANRTIVNTYNETPLECIDKDDYPLLFLKNPSEKTRLHELFLPSNILFDEAFEE